jgi:hypothetical protein
VIDLHHRRVGSAAGPGELPSMHMDFFDFQLVNRAAEAIHQSSVYVVVVFITCPIYQIEIPQ